MKNSKSQIPNSKQFPITKIPMSKMKYVLAIWSLEIGIYL